MSARRNRGNKFVTGNDENVNAPENDGGGERF